MNKNNSQHQFAVSNMSNAKWRKVFGLLANPEFEISRCDWKFTNNARIWNTGLPSERHLFDDFIGEVFSSHFGPFAYSEIEWISIPAKVEVPGSNPGSTKIIVQDFGRVFQALNQLGQFPLKLTEDSLIIYGYS